MESIFCFIKRANFVGMFYKNLDVHLITSVSAAVSAAVATALTSPANNISHCFICTRCNDFTSISNSTQPVIYNAASTLEDGTTYFTGRSY
jgi:hypothetical protein